MATADDNAWLPTGTDDYNVDANWNFNVVPELTATFQDVALIDNGGTAVLSAAAASSNAGITLTDGTLQIDRGGSLATGTEFGAAGELNQQAGGELQIGGLTGLGTASLDIAGAANLAGQTRILGPNANLTAGSFALSGTLNTVVTADGSSALSTTGNADVGGQLELDFSGVTPALGNSWTIVDAATITGGFTSVTTNASLGAGHLLQVNQTAGGNGTLLQASIEQGLLLTANRRTGELQLINPSTTNSIDIDGYLVSSPNANLVPEGWTSMAGQSFAGLTESNPTNSHLGELNLTGTNSIAADSRVSLGLAFDTSSLAGQTTGDLVFEYRDAGGDTISTQVAYVGPSSEVVLLVGTDGHTYLQNQSSEDVVMDGYFLTSASGSVNTAGWSTLATGDANWTSSPAAATHLGELRLSGGTTLLSEGEAIDLGVLFDTAGTRDLMFEYHVFGGGTEQASVLYDAEPYTFVAGDYNYDGVVDGLDYQLWKSTFGSNSLLGADGNRDGTVNLADYTIWRNNLGATAASAAFVSAQAVPEPSTALLPAFTFLAAAFLARRR